MGPRFRLDQAVADVYGDLRLGTVLGRLLAHTGRLTGAAAGSVSLVDAERGRYVKAAERGVSCRLGQSFPLDEGATGRAFGSRRPVVIPEYGRLRTGHLAVAHPARSGPAAAVPIWWRGEVIAVSVAFAPAAGALSARGLDEWEALAQSAAAAIVESRRQEASPAALIRQRVPPDSAPFTPREAEVLGLLRRGLTDRAMASRLGVSAKTVEKHVGAIMRKTRATNRTAAVVTALDRGWLGDLPHIADRPRGS